MNTNECNIVCNVYFLWNTCEKIEKYISYEEILRDEFKILNVFSAFFVEGIFDWDVDDIRENDDKHNRDPYQPCERVLDIKEGGVNLRKQFKELCYRKNKDFYLVEFEAIPAIILDLLPDK